MFTSTKVFDGFSCCFRQWKATTTHCPFLPDLEKLYHRPEKGLQYHGILQLRVVPATGAEKFAEFIFHKLNNFVKIETNERVKVKQVEFREHGKNSAIYSE